MSSEKAAQGAVGFVNPYTFVPLPEVIRRGEPAGHHQAKPGHVSGRMTVKWQLLTPLLLPDGHGHVDRGRVSVPGSAVKGAVRSLHETLMGGCLRILDEEFVPVYRQQAREKGPDWWLGVVRESTREGRATRIEVTTSTAWVPVAAVNRALGRPPRTGDAIDVDEWAIRPGVLDRKEVDAGGVRRGQGWRVLVGDTGPRGNRKEKQGKFFVAAGKLPQGENEIYEVTEEAWDSYEALCEGMNDLRLIRADPDSPKYKGWRSGREDQFDNVRWNHHVVGKRRRVTGKLWPGDVLWVCLNEESEQIDALSMAAIWRESGQIPMGERVPLAVLACQDPEKLCISCRLFGSADTRASEMDRQADQRSYAGHIRWGDATATEVTTKLIENFAPMGNPRPGAGQFYLRHNSLDPAREEDDLPTAFWGAEPDHPVARRMRGRKFYWHGDPDPGPGEQPRYIARGDQKNPQMVKSRRLVPAGTKLTQRITFDNISETELGSLVLTLMPGLLLPATESRKSGKYALRLGGGKPLGLGSCEVSITELEWCPTAERYRGGIPVRRAPEQLIEDVRSELAKTAGHPVRKHWPILSRILRMDGVNAQRISYPKGGRGARSDDPFAFFKNSTGRYLKSKKNIVPLPDPTPGVDQTIWM